MKVLISNAHHQTRVMLDKIFTKFGFETELCSETHEIFDILNNSNDLNLLLLDNNIKGEILNDVIGKIRKAQEDRFYYIIVLVNENNRDIALNLLANGADDFIYKPIDIYELQGRANSAKRIIDLQKKNLEQGKLKGALEMAGALAHEMNQPLQNILSNSEMIQFEYKEDKFNEDRVERIIENVYRITKKIKGFLEITQYRTKNYIDDEKIISDD